MPLDALAEGIPWTFETFPEYLDALDALPLQLNVARAARPHAAPLLRDGRRRDRARGHRRRGGGRCGRSSTRRSTPGAIGFSSSRSISHVGAYGRPVPSRAASLAELDELARAAARARHRLLRGDLGPRLPRRRGRGCREAHRPARVLGGDHGQQAPARRGGPHRRAGAGGGRPGPPPDRLPADRRADRAERPVPRSPWPPRSPRSSALPRERAGRPLRATRRWRRRAEADLEGQFGQLLDGAVVAESTVHADLVGGPTLGELAAARGRGARST